MTFAAGSPLLLSAQSDDVMGPAVSKVQWISGRWVGSRQVERPRCWGSKRNMACAGGPTGRGATLTAAGGAAQETETSSLGQTHWPASQTRASLQSLSDPQPGGGGKWAAHPATPSIRNPSGQSSGRWFLFRLLAFKRSQTRRG